MAVGVTVDKARQMKEAVDLVHGGEDRVCDWTEFFQMNETDYVALVNFTNTSEQHWTQPLRDQCQVPYISRVAREELQLGEGTGPATTKRQKRQERKVRQLQNLRLGGDAASGASETRSARMGITEAEREGLGDIMATRSEKTKK